MERRTTHPVLRSRVQRDALTGVEPAHATRGDEFASMRVVFTKVVQRQPGGMHDVREAGVEDAHVRRRRCISLVFAPWGYGVVEGL